MELDPKFKPKKGHNHDFWMSVSHDYKDMYWMYSRKKFEEQEKRLQQEIKLKKMNLYFVQKSILDLIDYTNNPKNYSLDEKIAILNNHLHDLNQEKKKQENSVLMHIVKKGKHTFVFHDKSQVENLTNNGWKQITLSELLEITKSHGLVHGKSF